MATVKEPANKKQRVEKKEIDFPKRMEGLSNLLNKTKGHIRKYNGNVNNFPFVERLEIVRDMIPTIVVWGMQSSGKSSFLNKTFKQLGFVLRTKQGICSKCPLELRFSKKYDKTKIIIDGDPSANLSNIDEAYKYIDNKLKQTDEILSLTKIIIQINSEKELVIVDLPGCIRDENAKPYFNKLKEDYLKKKETLIIHIVNVVVDPSNDISMNYLSDIKSKVMRVHTHADVLTVSPDKKDNISKACYDNQIHIIGLAICDQNNNEDELLSKILLNDMNKHVIKGCQELGNNIMMQYREKVLQLWPEIKIEIKNLKDIVENKLDIIGTSAPDYRDFCRKFRTEYCDIFLKEYQGRPRAIRHLEEEVSEGLIQSYLSIIPNLESLADKLKYDKPIGEITGAEGWSDIVKEQLSVLTGKVRDEIVNKFIDRYSASVIQNIDTIFKKQYHPCSDKLCLELLRKSIEEIKNIETNIKGQINLKLIEIANHPFTNNSSFNKKFTHEQIKDYIIASLNILYSRSDKKSAIDEYIQNPSIHIDQCIDMIDEIDDQYYYKAKMAYNHIVSIWSIKGREIQSDIIQKCRTYNDNIKQFIRDAIVNANSDDFSEPPETADIRIDFIDILDICNSII